MNNIMQLYHGSENIVEKPEFGKGNFKNDYGRGFYCTQNIELAKEWACGNKKDGFVNEYILHDKGLNIIRLNSPQYNILNWLAVLTHHRSYWQKSSIAEREKKYLQDNFYPDLSDADIIIGYRADDSYYSFVQTFINNGMTLNTLAKTMYLGQLGEQAFIKSEKAFKVLEFIGATEAEAAIYYSRKRERDQKARREYRLLQNMEETENELLMIDIVRGGIKNGDPRLYV